MEDYKIYHRKSKEDVEVYDIFSQLLKDINVKNDIGMTAYNILEGNDYEIRLEDIELELRDNDVKSYQLEVEDKGFDNNNRKFYKIKDKLKIYEKEEYTIEDVFRENWDEGILQMQNIIKIMEDSKEHIFTDSDYVYTELVSSYGRMTRILKEKYRIIQEALSYTDEIYEKVNNNSLTNIGLALSIIGYKVEEPDKGNYLIIEGSVKLIKLKEFNLKICYNKDTGSVYLDSEDLILDLIVIEDSDSGNEVFNRLKNTLGIV